MSVEETIAALDRGELRVAEKQGDDWVVNVEAKQAILDYFGLRKVEPQELGPFEYSRQDSAEARVRGARRPRRAAGDRPLRRLPFERA